MLLSSGSEWMTPWSGIYKKITPLRTAIIMTGLNSSILTNGSNAAASGSGTGTYVSGDLTAEAKNGSTGYYLGNPTNITSKGSNGCEIVLLAE